MSYLVNKMKTEPKEKPCVFYSLSYYIGKFVTEGHDIIYLVNKL